MNIRGPRRVLSMLVLFQMVSAWAITSGCAPKPRLNASAPGPSAELHFWAFSPVIQSEGDSLKTDELLPANSVFDPGLRVELGAPSCGLNPSIAYRSNHFSFGMVWWWLLFENHSDSIAHIQVAMGYPPGFKPVPGEPVFGTIPYRQSRPLVVGSFVPPNPPLLEIMPHRQFVLNGLGRTLDIQPISNQYPEILEIEKHIGLPGAVGPGVFRGGGKNIPVVHFGIWCDSSNVILKAGSYTYGLLLPVHPELINGNGRQGVSLSVHPSLP